MLVKVAGTPLENAEEVEGIDFVRTIAVAKIMMPTSNVRLSAGREQMSDELQASRLSCRRKLYILRRQTTHDSQPYGES